MTRLALLRRSFPTPQLIIRWLAKSRRRIACVLLVLLAIVAGPPLWWSAQLIGLPDIGDPFDIASFPPSTIPADRNAFMLYREADRLLKPLQNYLKTSRTNAELFARWSRADADLRRLLTENRKALAVYRQATGWTDAIDPAIRSLHDGGEPLPSGLSFRLMVLLEASRLEDDQGDMAGAWGWYRAMIRTIHHVGMRGSIQRRISIQRWYGELRARLATWAADPRTTPVLIRQALADVVACEELAPSEQDSLKASYLDVISLLESPQNPGHSVPGKHFHQFRKPNGPLTREEVQKLWDAWRFWRREPERSRRVIRLLTANWLAYNDLPSQNRPKPDPKVAPLDIYPLGPQSPASGTYPVPRSSGTLV